MCLFVSGMCMCVCACVLFYMYMQACRPMCVCVCLCLPLYPASVFARVSVTLMFSGDLQWTFELELRADFPRDDPAPYNPLCVTDHLFCNIVMLCINRFFCSSFDSAQRILEKDLPKATRQNFFSCTLSPCH